MWRFLILFPGALVAAIAVPMVTGIAISILIYGLPTDRHGGMKFFEWWMTFAPKVGLALCVLIFALSWMPPRDPKKPRRRWV